MNTDPITLRNPVAEYMAQMRRLLDGEVIPDDAIVDPPPITEGVLLRSATIRRGPDSAINVGGIVIGERSDGWLTVEARVEPSRIEYHTIAQTDIDWVIYTGTVNTKFLKDLRRALNADRARGSHAGDHLPALLVVERCLS